MDSSPPTNDMAESLVAQRLRALEQESQSVEKPNRFQEAKLLRNSIPQGQKQNMSFEKVNSFMNETTSNSRTNNQHWKEDISSDIVKGIRVFEHKESVEEETQNICAIIQSYEFRNNSSSNKKDNSYYSKDSTIANVEETADKMSDSTVVKRMQAGSMDISPKEISQVKQFISKLDDKKIEMKHKISSENEDISFHKVRDIFESKLREPSSSVEEEEPGSYVMQTAKLFGGTTVYRFANVSTKNNLQHSKDADMGPDIYSRTMFSVRYQSQEVHKKMHSKQYKIQQNENLSSFVSVAQLRQMFGTAGNYKQMKRSSLTQQQKGSGLTSGNKRTTAAGVNKVQGAKENEEEGDVVLEQALCRRILGKEVRKALKTLLLQQQLDAVKSDASRQDVMGQDVKRVIDQLNQEESIKKNEIFTNRRRNETILDTQASRKHGEFDKLKREVNDGKKNEASSSERHNQMEKRLSAELDVNVTNFGGTSENEEEQETTRESKSRQGSYEIEIDPDFVRRRLEALQSSGKEEIDTDDDDDDDDVPALIKTKSGRIVVDTSEYNQMSLQMALKLVM